MSSSQRDRSIRTALSLSAALATLLLAGVIPGVASAASTPTVSIAASTASVLYCNPVTLTATVSGGSGTPAGSVTFHDGGAPVFGTQTLDATGKAAFTTSTLTVGSHSITASYSGSGTYTALTSSALTQTVTVNHNVKATTTVTSSAATSTYGQPVTLTAITSPLIPGCGIPTGNVTFMDGGVGLGPQPLDATGHATFTTSALTVGSHTITAVYGGSSTYIPLPSNVLAQTVTMASTTTTVTSAVNPSRSGIQVLFNVKVVTNPQVDVAISGFPAGIVTFKDGSTTLVGLPLTAGGVLAKLPLAIGSHSITATYGGSPTLAASASAALIQVVNRAEFTLELVASPSPSNIGEKVTLVATVGFAPGQGSMPGFPTGTVTFAEGAKTLGTGTLTGLKAALAVTTLSAGAHSFTASYAGNPNFAGSTSTATTHTVLYQSSTKLKSSLNPSTAGQPVLLTAFVFLPAGQASGTVTFLDGSAALGKATLSNTMATLKIATLAVGAHTITAVYEGDASSAGSTGTAVTQTVKSLAARAATTTATPATTTTPTPASTPAPTTTSTAEPVATTTSEAKPVGGPAAAPRARPGAGPTPATATRATATPATGKLVSRVTAALDGSRQRLVVTTRAREAVRATIALVGPGGKVLGRWQHRLAAGGSRFTLALPKRTRSARGLHLSVSATGKAGKTTLSVAVSAHI